MNIDKMTLEEKLEYYQRQTHQLKKRRDDAIDKIEYLNGYIRELHQEINSLKSENKRLTDKLNETALEFLNYNMVTMGKATEISEMCYYDFLKFRKENGNPMELQE